MESRRQCLAQSNFAKIAPGRKIWPTARGGGREDLRVSVGAGCVDGPLIIIGGHEPKFPWSAAKGVLLSSWVRGAKRWY